MYIYIYIYICIYVYIPTYIHACISTAIPHPYIDTSKKYTAAPAPLKKSKTYPRVMYFVVNLCVFECSAEYFVNNSFIQMHSAYMYDNEYTYSRTSWMYLHISTFFVLSTDIFLGIEHRYVQIYSSVRKSLHGTSNFFELWNAFRFLYAFI